MSSPDDDELEGLWLSWLFKIFYPSSKLTPPDPSTTAARLTHLVQQGQRTSSLAEDLPTFLLHTATNRPAHTDHVLQTAKLLLLNSPSLPLINDWDPSLPNTTFEEMFLVGFRDDLDAAIVGPVEISERDSYIAASLLGARARSMNIINTPEVVGSLAEGLGFPNEVSYHYQGEQGEIAAIASCIQLLGGASSLVQDQPERFAKEKILAALDRLQSGQNGGLVEFTKRHLQKEPLVDLTSEEVDTFKSQGWPISGFGNTDQIPRPGSTRVINAYPVQQGLPDR